MSPESDSVLTGLVVACYGNRGILETPAGTRHKYQLKGRKIRAVCGDSVIWRKLDGGESVQVTGVRERKNALARPGFRGQQEVLASNVDQIMVVIAPTPEADYFLLDRFLCAAELLNINAAIVWNKADLSGTYPEMLQLYAAIGYRIISTSAKQDSGLSELQEQLSAGVSMLVGQSGVGKSSLINRLVPGADVAVGELSDATSEGKHTTTAVLMHTLPGQGKLIDSPGVREFSPLISETGDIQAGFREIIALADQCRFTDCLHMREPDCAVKQAVADAKISQHRYASYKRLHNKTDL